MAATITVNDERQTRVVVSTGGAQGPQGLPGTNGTNGTAAATASTFAGLGTPTSGEIRRVTDNVRGLWFADGTQWIQNHGRRIDITNFGADPTGVANSASAIQTALNVANTLGGGTVWRPAGTYLIETGLTIYSNTVLDGPGIFKMKDATNLATLLTVATGAVNVTIKGGVIDGNKANQTAAASACIAADTCTGLTIRNIEIRNARSKLLWLSGAGDVKSLRILGCYLHDSGTSIMDLRSLNGAIIKGNHIEAWGTVTAASPAIALIIGGANNRNGVISNNVFRNTVGTQFAIESQAASWVVVCDGFSINNNVFDGNGLGGNGVSGIFFRNNIMGNTFVNGGGTHRSGLELVGQQIVASGNAIVEGIIAVNSYAVGSVIRDITISDNNIFNSFASGVGGIGIQIGGSAAPITAITISDNDLRLTNANPQSAIYLGTFGTTGVINDIKVHDNRAYGPGAAATGIRLLAAAGSGDISVKNNIAKGFGIGFRTPSDANHNNVLVEGNDLRGNTSAITHGATGGTYLFKDNRRGTGNPFGVSADKGDVAATLTPGASEQTSVWNTPLTTARAVTLSAGLNGDRFKVVRTAAATGASSLNVGTGPLKALAVGQYAVVEHNGTAWALTEFGSL